jgi:hypothetical protein
MKFSGINLEVSIEIGRKKIFHLFTAFSDKYTFEHSSLAETNQYQR